MESQSISPLGAVEALAAQNLPLDYDPQDHEDDAPEPFRLPTLPEAVAYLRGQVHWLYVLVPLAIMLYTPLKMCWKIWSAPDSPQAYQPLIPLAVGFLLWLRREPLSELWQEVQEDPDAKRGSKWLLLVGCLLMVAFYPVNLPTFSMFAFVVIVWGVVLYVYGGRMFRAMLAPLLFLVTLVPFPNVAVDQSTQFLQMSCTRAAAQVIELSRIECEATGNVLTLDKSDKTGQRTYKVEVVAACSGMSILLPLLVMTVWLLMAMEATWTQRILMLFAAVGVAFFMNTLRIVAISLVGYLDRDAGKLLHDANSWLFTGLAFYLTFLAGRALGIKKLWAPSDSFVP